MSKKKQEAPATFIWKMAGRLYEPTRTMAHGYGLYVGLNKAIKRCDDKFEPAIQVAGSARREAVLMTITRLVALLAADDRSIFFQVINRLLRDASVTYPLAQRYASTEPPCSLEISQSDTRKPVAGFRNHDSEIDWNMFGRLQHSRNHAIAHIGWKDATKYINFGELDALIHIVCGLASEAYFFSTATNTHPVEEIERAAELSEGVWTERLRTR